MGLHKANQTSFKKGERSKNWSGFGKGHIPWNKGKFEEMSLENSPRWKGGKPKCKGCGKTLTQYKPKYLLCGNCYHKDKNYLKKISMAHIGINAGENHPNWKGGIGTERHRLMSKIEYRLWRQAVFAKDNWTCQKCSQHGGKLEADHIKPWSLYPELRYAINNGRTLCIKCHRQTETWGYRVRLVGRVNG